MRFSGSNKKRKSIALFCKFAPPYSGVTAPEMLRLLY